MILCPNCQEEIDDNSYYCDQCGKALRYCNRCGRVGLGRRCTSCGGLMVSPAEQNSKNSESSGSSSLSFRTSTGFSSRGISNAPIGTPVANPSGGMPSLTLTNLSLGIQMEAVNGAVIGRKQGPFVQFFQNNMYVSGVHAQLRYNTSTGWCIVDKHSSNGTKLNDRSLQPDLDMSLKDGDIVTIANVSLQVTIK